jgi:hypothetical protein
MDMGRGAVGACALAVVARTPPVKEMLDPWTPIERVTTVLVYAAYLLTFLYVFPRIKARWPHWEGRAELAAMVPGILMLLLLSLLTRS